MYTVVSEMYLEFSMVAKLAVLEQQFLAVPDAWNKYFWFIDVTIWCVADVQQAGWWPTDSSHDETAVYVYIHEYTIQRWS
jgi:hypothetical protein